MVKLGKNSQHGEGVRKNSQSSQVSLGIFLNRRRGVEINVKMCMLLRLLKHALVETVEKGGEYIAYSNIVTWSDLALTLRVLCVASYT